jgi:hypothetical protein
VVALDDVCGAITAGAAAGAARGATGATGAITPGGTLAGLVRDGASVGMPMSVFCISRLGRSDGGAPVPLAPPVIAGGGPLSRIVGGAGCREPGIRTVLATSIAGTPDAGLGEAAAGIAGTRDGAPLAPAGSNTHLAILASPRAVAGVPAAAPSGIRCRGSAGGDSAVLCSSMWASNPLPRASSLVQRTLTVPASRVTTASPSSTAALLDSASISRTWAPPPGPIPDTGIPVSPSVDARVRNTLTTSSTVAHWLTSRHAVPSATANKCRQFLRV